MELKTSIVNLLKYFRQYMKSSLEATDQSLEMIKLSSVSLTVGVTRQISFYTSNLIFTPFTVFGVYSNHIYDQISHTDL